MSVRAVDRCWNSFLLISLLALSWQFMMVVHECGHVLNGLLTGAQLGNVSLHPLQFSRTDFTSNPSPRFVAWGGPTWGCIIPAGVWLAVRSSRWKREYLLRFFAGFCLIANGSYLGFGWIDRAGDAGDLLRYGTSTALLIAYGAVAVPCGLVLWNGIGSHFGFGRSPQHPDRLAAIAIAGLLFITTAVELLFAS